jgi:molecular chaperone DnaK
VPRIEVSFDIDANGILKVSAKDLGTSKEQAVNVVPTSGLTEEQIASIVAEAADAADADSTRRELAEIKNQAESLLYTSERAMLEFGSILPDVERVALERDLSDCRQVLDSGTVEEVRDALQRLEASAQRIGELIYAQAEGGSGEGSGS